jgi:hypothetical protein
MAVDTETEIRKRASIIGSITYVLRGNVAKASVIFEELTSMRETQFVRQVRPQALHASEVAASREVALAR